MLHNHRRPATESTGVISIFQVSAPPVSLLSSALCWGLCCSGLICPSLSRRTDNALSGISEEFMGRLSDCLQIRHSAVSSVVFLMMISVCQLVGPVGQMSNHHCDSSLHWPPMAVHLFPTRRKDSVVQLSDRNPHLDTVTEYTLPQRH